jgi:hypothetical protein
MTRDTLGRGSVQAGRALAPPDFHGVAVGTLIYTQDGILPVEHLVPGDRIITRDAGLVTLRGLEVREAIAPQVQVGRGAFGRDRPGGATRLPAGQRILLRDWRAQALYGRAQVLVPLSRLVDGAHVVRLGEGRLRLFTLGFDRPHLIYANGLELASAAPAAAEIA